MKLRNKIFLSLLMLFALVGLTSCGSSSSEVSYANYDSIVTAAEATEEGLTASSYNEVILLLGASTEENVTNGDGTLTWTNFDDDIDGEYVTVTFEDGYVTVIDADGLYDSVYTTPIGAKDGVWNWVILQLGYFTFYASNLFGLLGNTYLYWLGLLIMTLVVRTIGWPVYARTNDMTLKMQMAQPELNKVQEKYRNRQDQASQQRQQMETMEIYKKYKINVFGCLLPLLQMPIFIAMYQVVQRFPLTDLSTFTDKAITMNINFLWTNLGNTEWLANLPLAIMVGVIMFLSQWLTQHRTKMSQKNNFYANQKGQKNQNTMKYVMYFMVIFMAYISLRNAGIAFYWVVGTSYQLLQSYLSYRNMEKRQEKLKRQF